MATVQYWIDRLKNEFKPTDNIAIALWQTDDVRGYHRGKVDGSKLNDKGIEEVLDILEDNHDASLGISWDTIDCTIDLVMENREFLKENF